METAPAALLSKSQVAEASLRFKNSCFGQASAAKASSAAFGPVPKAVSEANLILELHGMLKQSVVKMDPSLA